MPRPLAADTVLVDGATPEALGPVLAANQVVVYELVQVSENLEKLFLELTTSMSDQPAARMLAQAQGAAPAAPAGQWAAPGPGQSVPAQWGPPGQPAPGPVPGQPPAGQWAPPAGPPSAWRAPPPSPPPQSPPPQSPPQGPPPASPPPTTPGGPPQ